jgi:hypothetical protein
MRKRRNLLIAAAAAILPTSAALADTAADDRSYLPPQNLQAEKTDVKAAPQAERRFRSTHSTTPRHARGHALSGILAGLFR